MSEFKALTLLAFAFNYLPHSPDLNTQAANAYTATSNRVGWERLLTPGGRRLDTGT